MRELRTRQQRPGAGLTRPGVREMLPWLPTVAGVGTLIVLLIIAATRFTSSPETSAVAPPQPFLPAPAQSSARPPSLPTPAAGTPDPGPSATGQTRPPGRPTTPQPVRTSSRATATATATATPTTAPTPSPSPVTGRYRVTDSYSDGFMAEVLVTNSAGTDRDWRVELRFPPAVDDLVTSWVESAPQPTLRRSGDAYVWTSGAPVAANGQVALRFHFSRSSSGDLPSACTVNGSSCAGAR